MALPTASWGMMGGWGQRWQIFFGLIWSDCSRGVWGQALWLSKMCCYLLLYFQSSFWLGRPGKAVENCQVCGLLSSKREMEFLAPALVKLWLFWPFGECISGWKISCSHPVSTPFKWVDIRFFKIRGKAKDKCVRFVQRLGWFQWMFLPQHFSLGQGECRIIQHKGLREGRQSGYFLE